MYRVALAVLLAAASAASATVIIWDDFESYANTAALNAVWPKGVGTDADTYLATGNNGPTWPGQQYVHHTTVAARRDRTFADITVGAGEYLVWAFDYLDTVGSTTSPRQYGQLLSRDPNGTLVELIAMGMYNTVTKPGQVFNATKYQARVAFGPGQGWFNLNASRSVGWHRFEAHIYPTTVDFFVDGNPDVAGLPHNGQLWYQARIGSGLSSAGGQAGYDNYLLELVPEPASLLLVLMGGLGMLRRR
jgi:hypothetical protein